MAMEIKVGFEQTAQTLDVAFSNAQVFNSTYIPPIATTDEVGLVKPDGETITISEDGTITATAKEPSVATTETAGIVKPDGSTVTVDADGTIHAVSETVEVVQTTGDSETAVMSQKAVTDALANVGTGGETPSGIPFISSSDITIDRGTGAIAEKWAVAGVSGITTATDGMTVAVRMPTGGGSYGVNLSIDGGNTYYPIVQNVNTTIRMTYSQGSTLILTFNASQTVNAYMTGSGMTNVTGCWQTTDLNSDTLVSQYWTSTGGNYSLLFKYSEGITSTGNSTSYARFANNIYVNPSTGAMYANDFVVGGQSLDQRLQAVENLLAGVGVAEEGEF